MVHFKLSTVTYLWCSDEILHWLSPQPFIWLILRYFDQIQWKCNAFTWGKKNLPIAASEMLWMTLRLQGAEEEGRGEASSWADTEIKKAQTRNNKQEAGCKLYCGKRSHSGDSCHFTGNYEFCGLWVVVIVSAIEVEQYKVGVSTKNLYL